MVLLKYVFRVVTKYVSNGKYYLSKNKQNNVLSIIIHDFQNDPHLLKFKQTTRKRRGCYFVSSDVIMITLHFISTIRNVFILYNSSTIG